MSIKQYGLIGYPLTHSFSEKYFKEKFERDDIADCRYDNFPIDQIEMLPALISSFEDLEGLNVTIPYKQAVIRFLDELSPEAEAIGAVNTIKLEEGRVLGYNTDATGFEESLRNYVAIDSSLRALILGTGGASKAVCYVLEKMNVRYQLVSRSAAPGTITYSSLNRDMLQNHLLIINTTPIGMYPKMDDQPDLPYEGLSSEHYLYDLIYNPEKTAFLKRGEEAGCHIKNGMEMLILQAEKSWEIWNQKQPIP
ncbi:MAG: shikimate dehydrogenase [Saprospiraceae bacterium]|nr:shikimate dehydrogenase [Saprospiraceae bacterium]